MSSPRPRPAARPLGRALALSVLAVGSAVALPAAAATAADAATSWSTYAEYGYGESAGHSDTFGTSDATFVASGTPQRVRVEVHQGETVVATADFDAGEGNVLTSGNTVIDSIWAGAATDPALVVHQPADCADDGQQGGFTVHELAFAEDATLARFSATFDGVCSYGGDGPLHGSVAWQADGGAQPVPHVAGVAPEPVHELEVDIGFQGFGLSWVNPASPDWTETIVRGAVGTTAPATPEDGFPFYRGRRDEAETTLARPGTTYTISVFTRDSEGLLSAPVVTRVRGAAATLSATRTKIDYWTDSTLRGRLTDATAGTALAGRTVDILARVPGRLDWYYVDTTETDSTGRWSVPIGPARTYDYWVFFRSDGPSAPHYGGAVAGPVRVTVTMGVEVDLDRSAGRLGTTFQVGTIVGPTSAGKPVLLQRLVAGTWKTVKTGTLHASAPTYFTVKPGSRGTFTYRVYKAGTTGISAGVSRSLTIKVT